MLAELGQGVLDHSVFFDDTAARVKRSIPPIMMTVYGSSDDNAGQQVRDFHRDIKGEMPGRCQPLPRARPGDVLLGARHLRRAGAVLRRHLRQAADRGREGTDLPGVQDVVSPLRCQRSADARRLRWVPTVLGSHDRRDRRRTSHREVRRRLRHQGLPAPEGRVAVGVAAGVAGVQPGRRVPHHRWHAAAGPRPARPAVESTQGEGVPGVRRAVADAVGELGVGSATDAVALQQVRADGLWPCRMGAGGRPPRRPFSTRRWPSSSGTAFTGSPSTTSRAVPVSAAPPSTGGSPTATNWWRRSSSARTWCCSPTSPPS